MEFSHEELEAHKRQGQGQGGVFVNINDHVTLMKLIFWMLAAIFVTMTSIAGFTVHRLFTEFDAMSGSIVDLRVKVETAATLAEAYRVNTETRLLRLEKKLDGEK